MTNKFLKIVSPCEEIWGEMHPNDKGRFCDKCSKTVLDFTQLNPLELDREVKNNGDHFCARVTSKQLEMPLMDFEPQPQKSSSNSHIAATLLLAATLTVGNATPAQSNTLKTEWTVEKNQNQTSLEHQKEKKSPVLKGKNDIIFRGVVKDEKGIAVHHAKIIFVTAFKQMVTYSKKDGSFSMNIPENLVDDDNVIKVEYYEVIFDDDQKAKDRLYIEYEGQNFILTKSDLLKKYPIKADYSNTAMGAVEWREVKMKFIYIYNGIEMDEDKYEKLSNNNLKRMDFWFFESKFAKAIYGEKAKDGLYIINEKEK